jgi:hypothetical protein
MSPVDDYVIACRSYGRATSFPKKTYRMLEHTKLIDRLYVFVATAAEKKLYREQLPEFPAGRIVIGAPGLAPVTRCICKYFPEGQRIVFMDDDLEQFFVMPFMPSMPSSGKIQKDSTVLHKYLEDGFRTIDAHDLGSFTFSFLSNSFYLTGKPFKEFRPFLVGGNFFGCRNDRSLIPVHVGHADDVLRSSRFFERYGGTLVYWYAGFGTHYGKEAGGMQSSGDRGDAASRLQLTKEISQKLYDSEELLQAYATPPQCIENANLWSLKLKNVTQIRKAMKARGVELRWAAWDGLVVKPVSTEGI